MLLIWFLEFVTGMTDVLFCFRHHKARFFFLLMVVPNRGERTSNNWVNFFFQQTWKIDAIGCLASLTVFFLSMSVNMSTYFVIIFSSQQECEKVHCFFSWDVVLECYFFILPPW